MSVWFASDLHLGQPSIVQYRQPWLGAGATMDYHDFTIVENINDAVHKNDKLFLLGDIIINSNAVKWAKAIQCRNIEFIFGNHDTQSLGTYLNLGWKLHGFRRYKNFWLSHCPIHPQEVFRCKGNIHGHIHNGGGTPPLDPEMYFNVNSDFNNLKPVNFETIQAHFSAFNEE